MSKESVTIYLDEETIQVLKSIQQASAQNPEIFDMSKSEAGRELIDFAIDRLGSSPDLEELVDPVDLELWRKQREQDRYEQKGRIHEMRGGWRGRVRSRFNGRLAGAEPYPPDVMEDLTDLYMGEIETWEDDEEKIEDHRRWLGDLMQEYRDAYRCKQVVPDRTFEDAVDDVATGSDLLRIREKFGELIGQLITISESDSFDPGAILDRVSEEYAIDRETLEMILDEITGEATNHRQALKTGDGILDAIEQDELAEWSIDPDALPSRSTQGGDADD